MATAARSRISEDRFLNLPVSVQRTELLDGELVVSPSPTYWHQEIEARIFIALRLWAGTSARPVTVAQSPLDVRFGPRRILQPDIMVFLARLARDQRGPIARIPDLVVEILSDDRARDRDTKHRIYAEAGVIEYWLADPAGHIERRTGPSLTTVDVVASRLATPLLPGFSLDIPRLLSDAG